MNHNFQEFKCKDNNMYHRILKKLTFKELVYIYAMGILSPMLSYFPVFFLVTGRCVDKDSPDR